MAIVLNQKNNKIDCNTFGTQAAVTVDSYERVYVCVHVCVSVSAYAEDRSRHCAERELELRVYTFA